MEYLCYIVNYLFHLIESFEFLLIDIQMVDSIVCYQCTDCPEPFTETYPYVTISNNTNFLAQCTVSFNY